MVCDRANNDDGVEWGVPTRTSYSPTAKKSLAREFLAEGIDDLAKYHIVRLLYEYPSTAGDAAYFAAYLGFHSVELTTALLEQLVASGSMVKEACEGTHHPRYRLTDDGELRRRLIRLYNTTRRDAERDGVLRVLAYRSLAKARERATAQRHTPSSEVAHDPGPPSRTNGRYLHS